MVFIAMNLNPFDLRGPEFLVFYGVFSAAVVVLVLLVERFFEAGSSDDAAAWGAGVAKDPYQVAYLRGGRDEVIRVAIVSLVERQLLATDGGNLQTAVDNAADVARRPLDRAILTKFAAADKGQSVYSDSVTLNEAKAIGELLKQKGLLPDARVNGIRFLAAFGGVCALWIVAGIKMAVALGRGHHNILFLLFGAIVAALVCVLISCRRRTVLGNRTVAHLQQVFSGLNSRRDTIQFDSSSGDVAFLAAAFGMAAMPAALGTIFEPLQLRPPRAESDGGWAWGSSCGGGGGGCGGGGCGGGCGGCG
jgi:uncharacterized protein (TIGR04222 family)